MNAKEGMLIQYTNPPSSPQDQKQRIRRQAWVVSTQDSRKKQTRNTGSSRGQLPYMQILDRTVSTMATGRAVDTWGRVSIRTGKLIK
ncbi:hypothetical protein HanIR_Chr14g0703321 [Helianthus annuus]|nr:hypothetical protein HanIR_Chr14g0703321 [Helianthus annuus]